MAVPTPLTKTTVHGLENHPSLFLLLLGALLAQAHLVKLHRCHGAAFTTSWTPGGLRALGEAEAALKAGPGVASAAALLLVLGERLL